MNRWEHLTLAALALMAAGSIAALALAAHWRAQGEAADAACEAAGWRVR